jgi:hypothetical protein
VLRHSHQYHYFRLTFIPDGFWTLKGLDNKMKIFGALCSRMKKQIIESMLKSLCCGAIRLLYLFVIAACWACPVYWRRA